MTIEQQTMAELLKLGAQYFIPAAALLRALYSGIRGRFPQGVTQILGASAVSGVMAIVGSDQPDVRLVILKILGNTVFMAGLLSFIMVYLLRQPNRGMMFDAFVGAIIGLCVWVAWTYILLNPWPWWTIPAAVAAGAAGFVILRILLRQIAKLVRLATGLIVIGILLVLGGGSILLLQTVLQNIKPTP